MTNDIDYDAYPNCITGIPVFDINYLLQDGSPGTGMASDGRNLGLIDSTSNFTDSGLCHLLPLKVSPNPFIDIINIGFCLQKSENVQIMVIDPIGRLLYKQNLTGLTKGNHSIPLYMENITSGLCVIYLYFDNVLVGLNKAIKL